MNKEEIGFNSAKREFDVSLDEAKKIIADYKTADKEELAVMDISEADYIRLTRTIQLAERYLPRRELVSGQDEKMSIKQQIFIKLVNAYRNMKIKFNLIKSPPKLKKVSSSYLVSEELVKSLKKLRHYDYILRNTTGESEQELKKILETSLSGELIRERQEGPGILDDYRQDSWGVERICLDGIQNHLPNDAKGTTCWLQFEINGKWVDTEEAKLTPEKITRVRFADDGVGFTPENLLYLHSTKGKEALSVGQFGEGMKLASMASINLGLGMEFQSRNWAALAVGEKRKLINTRKNDEIEEHVQLVYNIREYDGEPLVGSRTVFHTPTPEFIEFALHLPEKVLALRPHYKPDFTSEYGDIVSTSKAGQVFVKGVFVEEIDSLFSYNFDKADVTPDRNQVTKFDVEEAIVEIMLGLNDIVVIKTLIAKMINYYKNPKKQTYEMPIEMRIGDELYCQFRDGKGMPSLWREAFRQVLEQKEAVGSNGLPIEAILKTEYEVPEQLREHLAKYNVVSLPHKLTLALQKAGIRTDRESLPEYISEIIPTSLSLDYGQGIWDNERIILDAVQNHLPADTGGRNIFLRFQTIDGKWHDFHEFDQFDDKEIKKIKISDNGRGYDSKNLGIFASVKDHNVSSGKWGEGLKMLSVAAIRSGSKITLKSRDWMAVPALRTVVLNKGEENEKEVQQLVFEVVVKVDANSDILADGDNIDDPSIEYYKSYEKSSTTFIDPSPDLIAEFRHIKEKVLLLQRQAAIAKVGQAEVLDFNSGKLYVRNIQIPGSHNIKYGYHFGDFDIETRDRNAIKRENLQMQLRKVLEGTTNERFISMFLKDAIEYAKGNNGTEFLEFTTPFTISSGTGQADIWISVFQQDFGKNTAIRSVNDQDMNAVHRAEHLSLKMITLPEAVARALINLKGSKGQTIKSYQQELELSTKNQIDIPDEQLTAYEKFIIEHIYKYNQILALRGEDQIIKSIRVYDYDRKYSGPKARGAARLHDDRVEIYRETLNGDDNLKEIGHVFFHESDHALSGGDDASKIFRNWLSELLSLTAMSIIPIDKEMAAKLRAESAPYSPPDIEEISGMAI